MSAWEPSVRPGGRARVAAPPSLDVGELAALDGLRVVPGEPETDRVVYHDTEDLRLLRFGVELRRQGDGWVASIPDHDDAGDGVAAGEHRFEGAGRRPPRDATELLTAYHRGAALVPVGRLRATRSRVLIGDGEREDLAAVEIEEVAVLDGRRVAERFRELVLAPAPDTPVELAERLLARLVELGAGAPDERSWPVRAAGPHAADPPDVVLPDLGDDPTAGEAVRAAIARSVVRYIRYEAGARIGLDEEGVHKARVGTRRLRSDLKTFRPLLDRAWAQDLRGELKWLADKLGDVRDAEVMHGRFEAEVGDLAERDREVGEHLIERLLDQRRRARRRLLEAMREPRYTQLLDRLVDAAHAPPLTPEAGAPAADVLPGLAAKPWRKLRKRVRKLDDPPTDAGLHEVRKRAKQSRYAAEAIAPTVGSKAEKFADGVSDVQDVLGDHQDATVAEAWLREAADGTNGRRAFVAGAMVTRERERSAETRAAWPGEWKSASKKSRRRWM